jgi:hypothetical protein
MTALALGFLVGAAWLLVAFAFFSSLVIAMILPSEIITTDES